MQVWATFGKTYKEMNDRWEKCTLGSLAPSGTSDEGNHAVEKYRKLPDASLTSFYEFNFMSWVLNDRTEEHRSISLKNIEKLGAPRWLSRLSIDFGSGHDLAVRGLEPHIRLCADGAKSAWDCVSGSRCPSPTGNFPLPQHK